MSIADTKTKIERRVKQLWISVLAGANIATVILLWASCLSMYLEPAIHPRLAQAGLLFPFLLFLNIAFLAIWIVTSWRWIVISIVGLIVCASCILDYWSISLPGKVPDDAMLVLTYNICYAATDSAENLDGDRTIDYIANSNADIICLQEYSDCSTEGRRINNILDSLGYDRRCHESLLIASRLPFVGDRAFLLYHDKNGCLAWRVHRGEDTLMVVNAHLRSNHISTDEKRDYSQALRNKDKRLLKHSGRIVLSRLIAAASKRQEQTDSICAFLRTNGERTLLCGDMNDTPISYTYHQFSSLLKSTWRESGCGAGISFHRTGFPVRIDYIFVSRNISSFNTRIDDSIASSDHYPVLSYIQL